MQIVTCDIQSENKVIRILLPANIYVYYNIMQPTSGFITTNSGTEYYNVVDLLELSVHLSHAQEHNIYILK